MNDKPDDYVRQKILAALASIAPELEPMELDAEINFRDQMDFDSMDFLNFAIKLHKTFGIDIPETDYPKLYNLDDCIAYFSKSIPKSSMR